MGSSLQETGAAPASADAGSARQVKIVIIAGDEGNANAGDQAMFLGLVRRLHSVLPGASIVSLSKHPQRVLDVPGVERYFGAYDYLMGERGGISSRAERWLPHGKAVVAVARAVLLFTNVGLVKRGFRPLFVSQSARDLLACLNSADLIMACGGGYLNSIWRYDAILAYGIIYRLGAAFGKPVVMAGQGIGPIRNRADALVLRWGLKQVDMIGLRDSGEGAAFLQSIGVDSARVSSPGDDASALPNCSAQELAHVVARERVPEGVPLLIAQFRPTSHSKDYKDEYGILASVLDALVDHFGLHVVFVPISHHEQCDDRLAAFAVSIRMRKRWSTTIVGGHYRPEVTRALIGMGAIAVGVSYHLGLFSLMQGVPFFSLYENDYYRLKFGGLYGHFGGPEWALPFQPNAPDLIVQRAEAVMSERDRIRQELLAYAEQMRERVDAFYERIPSLLQDRRR